MPDDNRPEYDLDENSIKESDSDSDSDCSFQSFSPITSEDEYSSDDFSDGGDVVKASSDSSEDDDSTAHLQDMEATQSQTDPSTEPSTVLQDSGQTSTGKSRNVHVCVSIKIYLKSLDHQEKKLYQDYIGCGDNLDHTIVSRYMRVGVNKPDSIHFSMAVADRVDFSSKSDQHKPTQQCNLRKVALSLLPTDDDDLAIRENISILISRVLFENVKYFNLTFDGVIKWHIGHDYWEEMSSKSVVVSAPRYAQL